MTTTRRAARGRPIFVDSTRHALNLLACAALSILASGCRGPTEEELAGTGVRGALAFGVVSLVVLSNVVRVAERIGNREWGPKPSTADWDKTLLAHAAISAIAFLFADKVGDSAIWAIVWGCAAANHLAWSLLVWRVTRWAPARAVLVGAIPSLFLGLLGGLGAHAAAEIQLVVWLWGGLLGAVPAGLIAVLWLEAFIRRNQKRRSAS